MKVVYIAHPISGDPKNNLRRIQQRIREISILHPHIIPFAPYMAYIGPLNDSSSDRKKGITWNLHFIRSAMVDEIWLYGDKISPGMYQEISEGLKAGIRIVPKTKETEARFQYHLHRAVKIKTCCEIDCESTDFCLGGTCDKKGCYCKVTKLTGIGL